MTKTMTLNELKMINGGAFVDEPACSSKPLPFVFWAPVTWVMHPEYGTGHVIFAGEYFVTVFFLCGFATVPFIELEPA